MARGTLSVDLTGVGAAEAFPGFAGCRAMRPVGRLDRLPATGRLALARLCALAPMAIGRRLRLSQIGDILGAPAGRPELRYAGTIAFFGDSDKEAGYGQAMRAELAHSALDLLAPS